MTRAEPPGQAPTLDREALAGFVLGLASVLLCLSALAGLPAIALGTRALARIEYQGPERVRGRALAVWALLLGGLGTLMTPMLVGPAIQAIREVRTHAPLKSAPTPLDPPREPIPPLRSSPPTKPSAP